MYHAFLSSCYSKGYKKLQNILVLWEKKSLFEQIAHWKSIGEWDDIKKWYVQSDTYERYFNIVQFVNLNKSKYGYRYREKILGNILFIHQFGYLDLDYLKKALFVMAKTEP